MPPDAPESHRSANYHRMIHQDADELLTCLALGSYCGLFTTVGHIQIAIGHDIRSVLIECHEEVIVLSPACEMRSIELKGEVAGSDVASCFVEYALRRPLRVYQIGPESAT